MFCINFVNAQLVSIIYFSWLNSLFVRKTVRTAINDYYQLRVEEIIKRNIVNANRTASSQNSIKHLHFFNIYKSLMVVLA